MHSVCRLMVRHFSFHSHDNPEGHTLPRLPSRRSPTCPFHSSSHPSPPCALPRQGFLAFVFWQGSGSGEPRLGPPWPGCVPWPKASSPQGSLFTWLSPSYSSTWSCLLSLWNWRCLPESQVTVLTLWFPYSYHTFMGSPFIKTSHTIPVPKNSNNSAGILSDRSDAWLRLHSW